METSNLFNGPKIKTDIISPELNELFNILLATDETDRIEAKEASNFLGKIF